MIYLRFKNLKNNTIQYGTLNNTFDKQIRILTDNFLKSHILTGETIAISDVKLLEPVLPSKIVAVGLNYTDHIKELELETPKEPCLFLKPPSAIIGPEEAIIYPEIVERLDYEAELAIVISKKTKNISEREALDHILGYTCLNDVTARHIQKTDLQWTRAKSFDTFCPIGPYICSQDTINGNQLKIESYLNQEIKQQSNTNQFIFTVEEIVCYISQVMTLFPGDVIATGTPPGIGPMKKGDTIEIKIENIGVLKNYIH